MLRAKSQSKLIMLVVRQGGYWWDGAHWYRPLQVIDYAAERYAWRKAAASVTVTAADQL